MHHFRVLLFLTRLIPFIRKAIRTNKIKACVLSFAYGKKLNQKVKNLTATTLSLLMSYLCKHNIDYETLPTKDELSENYLATPF